jgi:cold shock CspA family protein
MKGTVKWFSVEKGFGYIVDELGAEYYFHARGVRGADSPRAGESVSFVPIQNQRGVRATQVELTGFAPSAPGADSGRHGSRVRCLACSRLMVPRIITGPPLGATQRWTPVPKRSICPLCAATYREFAPTESEYLAATIQWIVGGVIIFILLTSFLKFW